MWCVVWKIIYKVVGNTLTSSPEATQHFYASGAKENQNNTYGNSSGHFLTDFPSNILA